MSKLLTLFALFWVLTTHLYAPPADWSPSAVVSREEILQASQTVLAMPDLPLRVEEDIFRIRAVGMDWDMGAVVYEPQDSSRPASSASR